MPILTIIFCVSAFAKDIDFNPVQHSPPKTPSPAVNSVRDLKPIVTLCDVGNDHYAVRDRLDEARCTERGGKLRGAIGDGGQYTDIKSAVPPIKAHYYNRPLQPQDEKMLTNPHFNPLEDNRADRPE